MLTVGRLVERVAAHGTRRLMGSRRASISLVLRVSDGAEKQEEERMGSSGENVEILFIRRARRELDPWSEHVAFPGGRADPGETGRETAVRETYEEIGLDLTKGYCFLNQLNDLPVSSSGKQLEDSALSSFVFLQTDPQTPKLRLSSGEVDAAFWIPLSPLMRYENHLAVVQNERSDGISLHPAVEVSSAVREISFSSAEAMQRWYSKPPRLWGLSLLAASGLLETFGARRLDPSPRFISQKANVDMLEKHMNPHGLRGSARIR